MEQGAPESTDELVEALVPPIATFTCSAARRQNPSSSDTTPSTRSGPLHRRRLLEPRTRTPWNRPGSIELFYRDGKPRHAYVVAGDRTLDAFGWRLLRHARAGSEESLRVSPAALLELLGAITPGARDGLAAGAELISREEIKREFGLASTNRPGGSATRRLPAAIYVASTRRSARACSRGLRSWLQTISAPTRAGSPEPTSTAYGRRLESSVPPLTQPRVLCPGTPRDSRSSFFGILRALRVACVGVCRSCDAHRLGSLE